MARDISALLLAAQSAKPRTPYIKMLFTSKDGGTTVDLSSDSVAYGDRILMIDHVEEPYNEYAEVILTDYDKAAGGSIPNIVGYWTEIGYGLVTGNGNEYAGTQTSRLWVKHQRYMTLAGEKKTVLELEGMWAKLREMPIRIGSPPWYSTSYTTDTIYDIITAILAQYSMTIDALGAADDGIIDTLTPQFTTNNQPFEMPAGVIYRLISMTKCYLRPQMGLAFKVVYPQAADTSDMTYYVNLQAPYFYSFMERVNALIPNHFYVYANKAGGWSITGEASDANEIAAYDDVIGMSVAANLTTLANANNRAAALLARARAEQDIGRLVAPHDGQVELYDKIAVQDDRQSPVTVYPTHNLTRVSGIRHIYAPGTYNMELNLGGVSSTQMDEWVADTVIKVDESPAEDYPDWLKKFQTGPGRFEFGPAPEKPWEERPMPPPVGAGALPELGMGFAPNVGNIPNVGWGAGWYPLPKPETTWQKITPWKEEFLETFGGEASERWRKLTPWREEAGETFGAEAMERLRGIGGFFSRLIGNTKAGEERSKQAQEARRHWWD